MEKKKFTVRLLPDDHARLSRYARANDWSYNKAIAHMIRQCAGKEMGQDGNKRHSSHCL